MKIITIGITSIEGETECIMSDNTPIGKCGAKLLSSFTRTILFNMNPHQPLLYKLQRDGIISYSFIQNQRIYTICTDSEIYPYTPANMHYLHDVMKQIITAHTTGQLYLISNMITEGESHQPAFDMTRANSLPAIRIHRLSSDRLNKLESDIENIKQQTSELTAGFTFFAKKREPVKKPTSFLSGLRWFLGLFSLCGSCMHDDQENQYQARRPS